jgi:glycosyltransferase involved in cell wall biosynthesis
MYPLIDRERFEVDVAYVLPWKDNYHQPLEKAGATVTCLGSRRPGDPRWVARLAGLLAKGRYDLVHTHAPVPAIAARLLSLGFSECALVHTEHNMWDRYRAPTRLANSLTYGRNSGVIAVSDCVRETINPWPAWRKPTVETVHHGTVLESVRAFTPEEVRGRRDALGLSADRFLIGNVGNFTAKKDHRSLLQALDGDGPVADAHLVLIGLGPLQDELEQLTVDLGIADRVTFLGSRDDVFELLPLLDLFAVSSQFEGFPIALVEAMATGLPCVATAVGGIPEIIDDGTTGLLVPAGDPAALRAAIERMITTPNLTASCGSAAREAAERLDLRNAVSALQEIYAAALGRSGAAYSLSS